MAADIDTPKEDNESHGEIIENGYRLTSHPCPLESTRKGRVVVESRGHFTCWLTADPPSAQNCHPRGPGTI
jgi:hypothetical protein